MKEREKNKKLKIILAIVLAVVVCQIAIVITLVVMLQSPSRRLNEQLSLAEKYLLELEYEQAIAAYQAAIEIDPKCEEAYLSMADIYMELGDYDVAMEVLEEAGEVIGSKRIQDRIAEVKLLIELDRVETLDGQEKIIQENQDAGIEKVDRESVQKLSLTEEEKKLLQYMCVVMGDFLDKRDLNEYYLRYLLCTSYCLNESIVFLENFERVEREINGLNYYHFKVAQNKVEEYVKLILGIDLEYIIPDAVEDRNMFYYEDGYYYGVLIPISIPTYEFLSLTELDENKYQVEYRMCDEQNFDLGKVSFILEVENNQNGFIIVGKTTTIY